MHASSSPPILYLGDDDDDDDNEQNQYFGTNMSVPKASSSNDMNSSRKKRKLTNANVRVNPSIVNWSKRQRNGHYQQRLSENIIESDQDSEPILLDPNEYVIEEPDSHLYRSFDWTIVPPPPPVIQTKISSNPIQTISRVSNVTTSNVNNIVKRPIDKPNPMSVTNSNDKFIQQKRKSTPISPPQPSTTRLPLPLPKPTSSIVRPVKNSRIPNIQSTPPSSPIRQRPEQQIFSQKRQTSQSTFPLSAAPTVTASLINNSKTEIRRQILNGTGIFSAFHDSKYYRCNICKFKSITSSTLLQHLFTHMFFCDQCSFYTYSYYNLSQHLFDKHNLNLIEEINEPLNPKSFDLLYVTRCSDGTFALCMDSSSSSSSSSTTNKISNNDQRFIISSATPTDQQPKTKFVKQKEFLNEIDNDIVLLSEKHDINNQSLISSKRKEKLKQTYVVMKHRRYYSMKNLPCLHSLTLEYNICREHTIRHMSHTQNIIKRRKFLTKFNKTRLIDEVADCLKTIVNNIINNEENSDQSSLTYSLSNDNLNPILSKNDLNILTNYLKLNNKSNQIKEQDELYNNEHLLRQNHEHIYILSSPQTNHTEQSIISSLHSSMTNGDSIFTQAKADKLSPIYDNTNRYLKGNHNIQPPSKVQKKVNTTQPSPKPVPIRPVISKPSRPLVNSSIHRNNNSVPSSKLKLANNIIVLD